MGFQRGVSSGYQDLLDQIRDLCVNRRVITAAVNAGGSSYAAGDLCRVNGGTFPFDHQAWVEVLAVSGGAVTSVRVYNCGGYTVDPSTTGAATTAATGSGSGLTVDLTLENGGWTVNRDSTFTYEDNTEKELQMEGTGGGTTLYVGIRTYNENDRRTRGFELAGFTGFNGGLAWDSQPGISPGRFETDENGAYVPLTGGNMPFWMSVDERRIQVVARGYNAYLSFYLGFLNTFDSPLSFPYPLVVGGCSPTALEDPQDRGYPNIGSIPDPVGESTLLDQGSMWLRNQAGDWKGFNNRSTITVDRDSVVYPLGVLDTGVPSTYIDSQDQIVSDNSFFGNWSDAASGTHASYPPIQISPTPDGAGGFVWPMVECTLMRKASSVDQTVYGTLDGIYWTPGGIDGETRQPEDRVEIGSERYIIFPTGQMAQLGSMWAMRES